MQHHEAQKRTIVTVAVGLTCLLGGLLGGGIAVHRQWSGKVADAEYLQKQLSRVSPTGPKGPRPSRAALVRVATARQEEIQPQRPVVGRLVEVRRTVVSTEVAGTITAMDVEEGSPVVGGKTVLAKVDDVWIKLAIDKQRAHIEAITAQVKIEEANLERVRRNLKLNVATTQEYEEQLALSEQRKAELREAQAQLADLVEQRQRLVIVAPFDGWVIEKYGELGQRLAVGAPIVDIVSRGKVYAEVNVPESLVNGLSPGMSIPVRIDSVRRTVSGKLATINPYGASAARTYPVRIELDDEHGKLKVGMTVTAIVPVGLRSRQLMVAADAVLTRPDGSTVWTVAPGEGDQLRARPVPVEIVASVGRRHAVKPIGSAPLADKSQVVIEGAERLYPNQAVRIVGRVDEKDVASAPSAARTR